MAKANLKEMAISIRDLSKWLINDVPDELLLLYERFQDFFEVSPFDLRTILKIRILVSFFITCLISPFIFSSSVSIGSLISAAITLIILYVEMILLMKPQRLKYSGCVMVFALIPINLFSHFFMKSRVNKFAGLSFVPVLGSVFFTKNKLSVLPILGLSILGRLYRYEIGTIVPDYQLAFSELTAELLLSSCASCIFCALTLIELGKDMENQRIKNSQLAQVNKDLKEANSRAEGYAQRLKSTVEELKHSNLSLKEALESKQMFFAKISDELRNPINSIVGNLELLEEEITDPEMQEKLASIKWSADLLLQMANNLIDIAKLSAGKIEISKRRTRVPLMLERLWAMNFYKMKQKGLKGVLSLDKRVPKYLLLDEEKLLEVCHNLITNSVKYTKKGQIKVFVTWHTEDSDDDQDNPPSFCSLRRYSETTSSTIFTNDHFRRLRIEENLPEDELESPAKKSANYHNDGVIFSTSCNEFEGSKKGVAVNVMPESSFNWKLDSLLLDNYQKRFRSDISKQLVNNNCQHKGTLKIEIIDTGTGIDPKLFLLLRKALFHKDVEVTKQIGGKGLGLYLACELTKLMDGEVYYYSKENLGTSVIVKIPCMSFTDDMARTEALKHQSVKDLETPKMALIVDDERMNRKILESFFRKFDIKCVSAENGAQAVEIFQSKPPGYFLFATVDVQMPVMDGKETCKKIREIEESEGRELKLPIAIVTGNCFEKEKNDLLNPELACRADYFYRKPLKMSDCENLVRDILGRNFSFTKSEPLIRYKNSTSL